MPRQPNPFSVMRGIASLITVPSGASGMRIAAVHDGADEVKARTEPAAGVEGVEASPR